MERRGRRLGVVPQRVLDADAEGREQQRRPDVLLVHHGQAGGGVPVLGPDRLELAERLDDRLLLGVPPVPLEERAGLGHRVEGGVGDVAVHLAANDQPAATVDLGPPDPPAAQALVLVPGEGVLGLVVVVVEVEDRCHLGHAPPYEPRRDPRSPGGGHGRLADRGPGPVGARPRGRRDRGRSTSTRARPDGCGSDSSYAAGADGPASVFVKLPPFDESQRRMVAATDMGRREARFYDGPGRRGADAHPAAPTSPPTATSRPSTSWCSRTWQASGCTFTNRLEPHGAEHGRQLVESLGPPARPLLGRPALRRRALVGAAGDARLVRRQADRQRPRAVRRRVPAGVHRALPAVHRAPRAHHRAVGRRRADADPRRHPRREPVRRRRPGRALRLGGDQPLAGHPRRRHLPRQLVPDRAAPRGQQDVAPRATTRRSSTPASTRRRSTTSGPRYRRRVLYAWVAATTTASMGSKWQPIEVGMTGMTRATDTCADLDTVGAFRELL